MPSSNCCFLTYIQVSQEAGQVVWYSHLFQNCPQFVLGWFISLLQFLSCHNKDLEWQKNYSSSRQDFLALISPSTKDSKQQTSYSLVTAQAGWTFIKKTVDEKYTPELLEQADLKGTSKFPLGFPFYTFCFLLLVLQNKACTCHQSRNGMQMDAYLRPIREGGISGHMQHRTFTYSLNISDWQLQVM